MADGSLSQFKATLARKKARKDKNQGKFDRKKMGFKKSESKPAYDFPELTDTELEKFKIDIQKKKKREGKVEFIFIVVVFFLIILAIWKLNN